MSTTNLRLKNSNSVPTYQTPLSSVPSRLTQAEHSSSSCLQVEPEHVINFDVQRGYSTFNIVTLRNKDYENNLAFITKTTAEHITSKPNCGILKPQECISITISIMSESVLTYFQTGLDNINDKFLIKYVKCNKSDITDENEVILEKFRKHQWNKPIKKMILSIKLNEREYMEPVKSFIIPPISNNSSYQSSSPSFNNNSNRNRSVRNNNNNNHTSIANRSSIITPSPLHTSSSTNTPKAATNDDITNSTTSPKSNINISSIIVTQNQSSQLQQSQQQQQQESLSHSPSSSSSSPNKYSLLTPEITNTTTASATTLESRCSLIRNNNNNNSNVDECNSSVKHTNIKSPLNAITSNSDSISSLLDDFGKVEDDTVPWVKGLPIGKGVMGTVYKGMHKLTGDLLAIKEIILKQYDNKIIEQISTELAILKNIRHINIVHYYTTQIIKGNDTSPAYINIIMEYVSGGSLADIIKKFGKISEDSAKTFVHQLLQGLEYLHENGITHRDIKGGNILLTETGIIKISDFGTSCSIFHDDPSKNNMQIGTPQWCAPEALKDQSLLEPKDWKKADVWSVGCFILEIITAEPPWGMFDNTQNAIYKIVEANTHPPIPEDGISDDLRNFLEKCFVIDPKKRPTVQSLLVEKWLHSEEVRRVLNNIDRPQTAIPHCNSDLVSPVHGAGAVEIQENDLFVMKRKNKEKKNYLGIFSSKYKSKKKTVLTMGGVAKQERVLSASVADCYYPPIDKKLNEQQQQQSPPTPPLKVPVTPHDFEVQAMLKKSTSNTSSTTVLPDINSKQNKCSSSTHKDEEKQSKFNYDNSTINKLTRDNKRQPISSIYKESKELVETLRISSSDVIIIKHERNKSTDTSDEKIITNRTSKSQENSDPIKNSKDHSVSPLKKLKSTKSGLMHPPIPPIPDISIVNVNTNNTALGRPMTAPGKSKNSSTMNCNSNCCSNKGSNCVSSNSSYYLPENDPILIYLNNLRTLYSVVFGSVPCKYSDKELLEKFKSSRSCLLLIDNLDYINRIFEHWINIVNNYKNSRDESDLLSLLIQSPIQKYTFANQNKYKSLDYHVIRKVHKWIYKVRLYILDAGIDNRIGVKACNTIANKIWKLYQLFSERYLIINNHLVSLSNDKNNISSKKYIEYILKKFKADEIKEEVYNSISYLRLLCEMNTQSYSRLKSHLASPTDKDDSCGIPDLHSPVKKNILKEKISLANIKEETDKEEKLKKKKNKKEDDEEKNRKKNEIKEKEKVKEKEVKNGNKKQTSNIKPTKKKEATKTVAPLPTKYNNNNITIVKTLLTDLIDQIINKYQQDITDSSPQLLLFPDSNKQSLKLKPPPTTTSSSSSSSQNYSTEKSTLKSFTFSGESSPYYSMSPSLSVFNDSPNTMNRQLINDSSIVITPLTATTSFYEDGSDEQDYYVIENYKPEETNELELKRGDIIRAKKSKNDWWEATNQKNQVGWVPKNFLEPLSRINNDLSFIEEEGSVISRSASVMSMDGIIKKKGDKKKVDDKIKMDRIKEEEN